MKRAAAMLDQTTLPLDAGDALTPFERAYAGSGLAARGITLARAKADAAFRIPLERVAAKLLGTGDSGLGAR